MDFSFSDLNFNSIEHLPCFEARAAFTVNSASVFREDMDIVPTVVDDSPLCIPTVDSTYYPIPNYGVLFRGKWYNIKQLSGIAKEAKLKNSDPIKYHIEVGTKYWESIFRTEGITDRKKQQERIAYRGE
ncbi:MAG: hypothetical protein K2N05_09010 [Muribaculaceae bacterium]|nr:hypothetical protein [Muribaculaceae bacterium]